MATTVSYTAYMCTRKTNSSSNAKSGVACQEFYDSSYNYVGIIYFSGMNLANKVITGTWLSIDAASAGYSSGSTKTLYMRKANYQNSIQSGMTGLGYTGNVLGIFDGSFMVILRSTRYRVASSPTWRPTSPRGTIPSPSTIPAPVHHPMGTRTIICSGRASRSPSPMRRRFPSLPSHPCR